MSVRSVRNIVSIGLAIPLLCGCGVVWDSDGQRHAFGIGYVSWPLLADHQTTIVQGVDVIGASLLATNDTIGIVIGYSRERSVKLDEDRFVALDCLQCDLANARPSAGSMSPKIDISKDKKP